MNEAVVAASLVVAAFNLIAGALGVGVWYLGLGPDSRAARAFWLLLRVAPSVGERMGTTGLNIATRILGLILAAIAIETMADGLKGLFPALG